MESAVTCPSSTCTLVIMPYKATAEDYAAVSLIFGAIFTAACLIWGLKQIHQLLKNRNES